ncbi:MAG: hypothetical protein NVS2B14_11520 [Chamaesiphon sp.]
MQYLSTFSRWVTLGIGLCIAVLVAACSQVNSPTGPSALNSRYNDEEPALSGNGRFLAFVSNRDGSCKILLYDLQLRQFVDLPGLNQANAIAQTPSLSRNGRYIAYMSSDQGRPEVELYNRSTRTSQVLTSGYRGWVRNPSISPDGRYIAFESGSHGHWEIEVLDRGPNIELDMPDSNTSTPR